MNPFCSWTTGMKIFRWSAAKFRRNTQGGGGGYSPKNLVGCAAAAQNPYPIYDQNLWFSLPFLSPDQIFDTLFMTIAADTVALNIIFDRLLFMVLSIGATHTYIAHIREYPPGRNTSCMYYKIFMVKGFQWKIYFCCCCCMAGIGSQKKLQLCSTPR